MRILLVFLLTLISLHSRSQNRQKIIKLFSGYDTYSETKIFKNFSTTTTTSLDEKNFRPLRSISIAFHKENNFHEIEISEMQIANKRNETTINNITVNGNNTTTTAAKLRYSYNYIFNNEAKLKMIAGLALAPSFNRVVNEPLIGSYKRATNSYGIDIEILPRIQYQLSPTILIEFNIPIPITTLLHRTQRNFDPSQTIEQQKNSDSSVSFIDTPSQLSLGIGYKF